MQEIQIYATANETVAAVRDSANAKNVAAPSFVLGVSAKLKLSLFADKNDTLPLAPSELANIVTWSFVMDTDFDVTTDYKVVADNANITWSGALTDGEKYTEDQEAEDYDPELAGEYIPTVFTIPLPDMNSAALNAWIGTQSQMSGLIGELVGYDSNGTNVFVLQLEGFTVRNRITGAGEPSTEQATEYLTVDQARAMFLTDSHATVPYIDIKMQNSTDTSYDGRYYLHESMYFRTAPKMNCYARDGYRDVNGDVKTFIQYSDSLKGWVMYKTPSVGMPTAEYIFPWVKTASNPGPVSGNFKKVSNPDSTTFLEAEVTPRYNIAAQTY